MTRRVPPELVIFDCDGVLVDSEPISIAVLVDVIARAGGTIAEDEAYRLFLGRSMATVRGIIGEELGLDVTDAELDRMRAILYGRLRSELKAIAGVADALRCLAMPYCVASSSQPERIRLSLDATGLLEFFEPRIYSSTMVNEGKPAPDLFLHAAREMGVAPARCVVIEDSPAGIEAARRAGMRVFAFSGGTHAQDRTLLADDAPHVPDLVFADMRDLPRLLTGADRPGEDAVRPRTGKSRS